MKISYKPWDAAVVRKNAADGRALLPLAPPAMAAALRKKYGDGVIPKDEVKLLYKWNDGSVSPGGVRACLAILGGARGGVNLPEGVSQVELRKFFEGILALIHRADPSQDYLPREGPSAVQRYLQRLMRGVTRGAPPAAAAK